MSRLKELKSEWKRLGEENRKTFTPKASGLPLKIFTWWEEETGKVRRPVNLCRYFWTVVLWAPLLLLRKQLGKALRTTTGLVAVSLMALAAFVTLCVIFDSLLWGTLFVLTVAAMLAYIFGSFSLSYHFYADVLDDEEGPGWYRRVSKSRAALGPLLALSAPAFFILSLVALGIKISDTEAASKAWTWFARKPRFNTMLTLRSYSLIALFVGVQILFVSLGVWDVLIITAGVLIFFGLAVVIGETSERIKEKRKPIREQKTRERLEAQAWSIATALEPALQLLFEHYHPKKAEDSEAFLKWKRRYFEYINSLYGPAEWFYVLDHGNLIFRLQSLEDMALYTQIKHVILDIGAAQYSCMPVELDSPPPPNRATSFIAKTGSAIGEFASLFWQGFKSLKWQICPWIQVDES